LSQLNQNRYDQLLRRVGDLKGGGSKVNDALTELFPMIDVENVPAELLLLMGSRLALGGADLAVAGGSFFNQAMLRNPGQSGIIITLLEARPSSLTSQTFAWGPTVNTLPDTEVSGFTDTRVFGEGTVGQVLSDQLLVPGPSFGFARVQSGRDFVLAVPRGLAVLGPGTAFGITCTTLNTDFQVAFTWLERVAQPSELNL